MSGLIGSGVEPDDVRGDDPFAPEPVDIGTPIMPEGYCPDGWTRCDAEKPARDQEVIVLHAHIDFDGEVRTGKPVRWFRYVSTWNGSWDEPEVMSNQPSAAWSMDDSEYANEPSFWQALPALPADLPIVKIEQS